MADYSTNTKTNTVREQLFGKNTSSQTKLLALLLQSPAENNNRDLKIPVTAVSPRVPPLRWRAARALRPQ